MLHKCSDERPSLIAVDVAAVHTDVRGLVFLCGREPAPKAGRDWPFRQPLHIDVLVLSLNLYQPEHPW